MEENYKIICFVHNEFRNTKGLFHAFGDEFFPNSFVSQFIYENNNNELTPKFGQGEGIIDKFLLITNDTPPDKKATLNDTDNWDILLVSHDKGINDIPQSFLSKNVLVMYHQNQDNKKDIINNNLIKIAKQGQHEPIPNFGYPLLLGLNKAWENNKFDQEKYATAKQDIIDWFGINDELEAKLELLHNCLLPSNAPTIKSFINEYKILEKYKNDYESFLSTKNGLSDESAFDENYIKALKNLRIALLGS